MLTSALVYLVLLFINFIFFHVSFLVCFTSRPFLNDMTRCALELELWICDNWHFSMKVNPYSHKVLKWQWGQRWGLQMFKTCVMSFGNDFFQIKQKCNELWQEMCAFHDTKRVRNHSSNSIIAFKGWVTPENLLYVTWDPSCMLLYLHNFYLQSFICC